jgi:hypothetical protein
VTDGDTATQYKGSVEKLSDAPASDAKYAPVSDKAETLTILGASPVSLTSENDGAQALAIPLIFEVLPFSPFRKTEVTLIYLMST